MTLKNAKKYRVPHCSDCGRCKYIQMPWSDTKEYKCYEGAASSEWGNFIGYLGVDHPSKQTLSGVLKEEENELIHIDNYKEKKLLIAHYFCGKSRKELSPHEVFDMWSNWFRDDFRADGKPVFCIVNDELVYKKSVNISDENIRRKYNDTFQDIYTWIKQTLETDDHNKLFFRQELDNERNREFGKVIRIAKPMGYFIRMETSYNHLAKFQIMEYKEKGRTITSGDCDKIIKYLKKHKIKEKK